MDVDYRNGHKQRLHLFACLKKEREHSFRSIEHSEWCTTVIITLLVILQVKQYEHIKDIIG